MEHDEGVYMTHNKFTKPTPIVFYAIVYVNITSYLPTPQFVVDSLTCHLYIIFPLC